MVGGCGEFQAWQGHKKQAQKIKLPKMHSSQANELDSPRPASSLLGVALSDESWDRGIRHSSSNNNNN